MTRHSTRRTGWLTQGHTPPRWLAGLTAVALAFSLSAMPAQAADGTLPLPGPGDTDLGTCRDHGTSRGDHGTSRGDHGTAARRGDHGTSRGDHGTSRGDHGPVEETTAPVEETTAPVEETTAPVEETTPRPRR